MRRWEFLLVGLTLGMAGARLQAQVGAMYTAEWQVALLRNTIDRHKLESELSCLCVQSG